MPNIFNIPELVDAVVSQMTISELAAFASVNSIWFDACIRHTWKFVTLWRALSLLGPTIFVPKSNLFVEPRPSFEPWERFRIYSVHVQIITACGWDTWDNYVLEVAIQFRPSTIVYLFPNLHTLSWTTYLSHTESLSDLGALISPQLTNVHLRFEDPGPVFIKLLCQVIHRLPTLVTFRLDVRNTCMHVDQCTIFLHQVLKAFASTLTRVQISECFYTAETLRILGKISNLETLRIGLFPFPAEVLMVKEYNSTENFSSLQILAFSGSETLLCEKFLSNYPLYSLVELDWHQRKQLWDIDYLVTTVVKACPQLAKLTVGHSSRRMERSEIPVVSWRSVRPLLTCRSLSALSLCLCRVKMVLQDLTELLTSRILPTRWRVLEIFTNTPLGISAISLFARYCPDLERLGVIIGRQAINEEAPVPSCSQSTTFSRLVNIDFADSAVDIEAALETASLIHELSGDTTPSIDGWDDVFCQTIRTFLSQERGSDMQVLW